jgi:hypothetical protein
VLVDGRPQVVHHALADLVREQRLDDAERAGEDGDRDHAGDEPVEQPEVLLGQRHVDHLAQQQRGDDAERGGEEDQREDTGQPAPVGTEERDDPAQVGAANGAVGRPLRRILVVEGSCASSWHP